MVPAIPEVETDVPGTGTLPTRGGGVETSGAADNALVLEVLLIGVVLVSSGGKRRRVNSSITQLIQYSWREGCGSTGAALDIVADWSVLTTEVEPWLAGVGCTAAELHTWISFGRFTPSSYCNFPGRKIA